MEPARQGSPNEDAAGHSKPRGALADQHISKVGIIFVSRRVLEKQTVCCIVLKFCIERDIVT